MHLFHDWEVIKSIGSSHLRDQVDAVRYGKTFPSRRDPGTPIYIRVCLTCLKVDDQIAPATRKINAELDEKERRQKIANEIYNKYLNIKASINSGGMSVVE